MDGSIQDDAEAKEYDNNRTYELNEIQVKVIRFHNEEVLENIEGVLKRIAEIAHNQKG